MTTQRPTLADLQYRQRAIENGWPCHDWNDPEYADVDEAGQLALGVAGEQRAIPGLAPTRKED